MLFSNPLTPIHILFGVSASSQVAAHGYRAHRHDEDDNHVVVQHRLLGSIHGHLSFIPKVLQESKQHNIR